MNIIILAAGIGSRLNILEPKVLFEIDDKSLLFHKLKYFNPSDNIIIVTGYEKEMIEKVIPKCIKTVYNPDYKTSNNWKSLLVGLEYINNNDDIIIFDGDTIFEESLINDVKNSKESVALIDNYNKVTKESMKVIINNNIITECSKEININNSNGEFTGLMKIKNEDINSCIKLLKQNKNKNSFYDTIIIPNIKIKPIYTNGKKWIEIDTYSDYRNALKLFNFSH